VLARGEHRPSNRGRRERPGVESSSLDEQKRPHSGRAKPPELAPETACRERRVEVANALSLHDRTAASVVADRKIPDLDLCAELPKPVANAIRLVYVDLDANHLNPHAKIVHQKTSRICTYRSREARTR